MSEQERKQKLAIRRILVALDGSHHSLAALEAAVELASSLEGVELQGLFVEEVELLRVAELPGAQEIRYPFNTTARLDRARMERLLRAQAEQARTALARACKRREIKWSFRVTRGDAASKVLEAASEADLLSLGKASRPLLMRAQMGSTAQAVAERSSSSVLVLSRESSIRPPIVASYDDTSVGRRTLRMAASLAQNQGKYLSILIRADMEETVDRLKNQAADWLRGEGLVIRYQQLPGAGLRTLIDAVRKEGSGTLVLSGTLLDAGEIQRLLDELECPVLILR